jgi:hypothetical protein
MMGRLVDAFNVLIGRARTIHNPPTLVAVDIPKNSLWVLKYDQDNPYDAECARVIEVRGNWVQYTRSYRPHSGTICALRKDLFLHRYEPDHNPYHTNRI